MAILYIQTSFLLYSQLLMFINAILLLMQVYTMLSSQLENFKHLGGESYHVLATYLISLINSATIVVFLPIVNHTILPFFSAFAMSLRVRLGIGQVFNLLAALIAMFLQGTVEVNNATSDIERLLWLFLPAIILSVGETLTFVTGKAESV